MRGLDDHTTFTDIHLKDKLLREVLELSLHNLYPKVSHEPIRCYISLTMRFAAHRYDFPLGTSTTSTPGLRAWNQRHTIRRPSQSKNSLSPLTFIAFLSSLRAATCSATASNMSIVSAGMSREGTADNTLPSRAVSTAASKPDCTRISSIAT